MNQEQEYRFPNNFIWGHQRRRTKSKATTLAATGGRVSMPKTQTFMNHQETRRTVTTGMRRISES